MEWIVLWSVGSVLGTGDVEVDDNGLLAAAHDHGLYRLVFARVKLLVGNVGRDVDEVSGPCFVNEFQLVSPAKAGAAAYDVDYSFEFAMMMRSGLRIGMNHHGSGPQFLRANFGMGDGFGASHAGRLRGIGVEFAGADNTQAVIFPVRFFVSRHAARIVHGLPHKVVPKSPMA